MKLKIGKICHKIDSILELLSWTAVAEMMTELKLHLTGRVKMMSQSIWKGSRPLLAL